MDKWPTYTVEELVDMGVLRRPMDGNHGSIHPKTSDFVQSGIPFVMASDLREGRVDLLSCAHITEEQARSLRKGFAKQGDVLLSHKATIGRTAIVQVNEYPFIMLTPQITYYRIQDDSRLSNRYLKYYFDSRSFQKIFETWADAGSTRAYLGITAQGKLPIILPSIDFQERIVETIAPLDDKIELNRRMNETLEAMARAIFKDWFVDFGPTRAKAEGREPYLAPEIWNLFPATLDDDDKPEGWETQSVIDQAEWVNGAAYKNMHFGDAPDALPVVKIAELKAGVTSNTKHTNTALGEKYRIVDGEVLFSWSGNPDTSIDTFIWTGGDAWLNQHIFAVRDNGKRSPAFLYTMLKRLKPEFAEIARNKQTTGLGHVTKQDLKRMQIHVGSVSILSKFDDLVGPIHSRLRLNLYENNALSSTRDLLLPKLMSGEIRLREAEQAVEAVA